MSVTQQKKRVNVLEREVMKIKIVIGEKHMHTQTCVKALINTHARTKKRPHTDGETSCVFYRPHLVWSL